MRSFRFALALGLAAMAGAAQAATVIVYTDPMTMERRTVVLNTPGPDRALMCTAPPALGDCTQIPIRRAR